MAERPVTATDGVDLMVAVGVGVAVRNADTVALQSGSGSQLAHLRVRRSPVSQWDIRRDAAADRQRGALFDVMLYIVPLASRALTRAAKHDPRIAVASVNDRMVIVGRTSIAAPATDIAAPATDTAGPATDTAGPATDAAARATTTAVRARGSVAATPGRATHGANETGRRAAWTRFAVIRSLVRTSRPRSQADLARECGVSPTSVAQALASLDASVVRTEEGWRALRPERLWEQFFAEYPGPQGITTYWRGPGPVVQQALRVCAAAQRNEAVVSGDAAADAISASRPARLAVVFARSGADLASIGFAETTRKKATLAYVVPADLTIWSTALAFSAGVPGRMTDPVLTAWVVRWSGGADSADAVAGIERAVVEEWSR